MKNLKGHVITTLLGFGLFIGLAFAMVQANDKEFIISYAKSAGISVDDVRLADNEQECFEDEFFDDRYGLCVVSNFRFTDSDVESK